MTSKKNSNKYLQTIKNLNQNTRGRAILFFLFYLIFFIVIIGLIRASYTSNKNNDYKRTDINEEYKLDGIINGNYHFTREEIINNSITNYVGDKSNKKEEGIMTFNNALYNYFIYDNINLLKINDKYEISGELYKYNSITNDTNIAKILKNATLISKTEYEIGSSVYNYQITTNTLDQIVNNTNIDIADIPNTITLYTNEDDQVVKIIYDLTSYATYYLNTQTSVKITIEYSNFGEIEDLKVPENN